jgi:uncharacterized protein YndB with AHSA1/START domain
MEVKTDPAGMMTVDGDHATVTFERHYAQPPSVVWRALTDPGEVSRWLDDAAIDLRIGGRFDIHFSDGEMHGVIDELDPGRVLGYSWHEGRDDVSHVRWELAGDESGTHMTLVHTRLAMTSRSGFAAGWHHHLERLTTLLAGSDEAWSDARFSELMAEYEAAGG